MSRCTRSLLLVWALLTVMLAADRAGAQGSQPDDLLPVAVQPTPGQPEFVPGCTEYVLKLGGGSGVQGSFGGLDLSTIACAEDPCRAPDGGQQGGGLGFRCRMTNGFPCWIPIEPGTCVAMQVGTICGNSAAGIHDRFALDTDQRDVSCYSEYAGNGERHVVLPITPGIQQNCYPLVRYGHFFLTKDPTRWDQCMIYADFLGYAEPTPASGATWGQIKLLYR